MRPRIVIFIIISVFLWTNEICFSPGGVRIPLQAPPTQIPAKGDTIRIRASLVLVPVSVTDERGCAVKNLQLDDFIILENGSRVAIERLSLPELVRTEMVLVFDVTGSTRPRFDFERRAAASFLKSLYRPGDEVSIVCIASEPKTLLEPTESLDASLNGLDRLQPFGTATAFFDSIIAATRLFRGPADPDTRRVIVALSDGEDNLSTMNLADALRSVQLTDCIFYSINPTEPSARHNKVSLRGQQWMELLAEQTGGTAFEANSFQELNSIYGRISAELQVQYLISYYSPDPREDNGFRSIAVRVPNRPELHVRARKGYYASKLASH
jgi:VWFA-related protein